MHSGRTSSGNSYNHNGDFDGDVLFNLPKAAVEEDYNGRVTVRIDFRDLADIVAKAVLNERIRKLEQLTPAEILGLDLRG